MSAGVTSLAALGSLLPPAARSCRLKPLDRRVLLACHQLARACRSPAPLRPAASPSSRRIAIQRAFGRPGAAASISGTSSATACSNSGVSRRRAAGWCARSSPDATAVDRLEQRVYALAGARHDRRSTGTPRSRARLRVSTSMPLRLRLVHQVHGDDHAVGDLQHLQHEVQIALERAWHRRRRP